MKKLPVIALAMFFALGSTLALAQAGGGASGGSAGAGTDSSSAIKGDKLRGARDSSGSGSGNASATTAGGATGGPAGAGSSSAVKSDTISSPAPRQE